MSQNLQFYQRLTTNYFHDDKHSRDKCYLLQLQCFTENCTVIKQFLKKSGCFNCKIRMSTLNKLI